MQKKINNWRIWKKNPSYGEKLYKRATGKLDEMESSKALSRTLSSFYKPKMKLLDVGCGVGHYLRSFRLRLDKNIDYTGVDATEYYIQLAKKAFNKNHQNFFVGDVLNLPFKDNSFDIVICNNLILHLPPPPIKAISELIRVSKNYVVIRTVFGERNYIIKEVKSPYNDDQLKTFFKKTKEIINKNGEPFLYNFFNIYTEQYLKDIIRKTNKDIKIKIVKDDKWKIFGNKKEAKGETTATRVIDKKQVSGNLLLDWRFIILKKG